MRNLKSRSAIQVIHLHWRQEDRSDLGAILGGDPWTITDVTNIAEAIDLVCHVSMPMILCDEHWDDCPAEPDPLRP
jgi:hypothetical protein